jgi:hypothetical protein
MRGGSYYTALDSRDYRSAFCTVAMTVTHKTRRTKHDDHCNCNLRHHDDITAVTVRPTTMICWPKPAAPPAHPPLVVVGLGLGSPLSGRSVPEERPREMGRLLLVPRERGSGGPPADFLPRRCDLRGARAAQRNGGVRRNELAQRRPRIGPPSSTTRHRPSEQETSPARGSSNEG